MANITITVDDRELQRLIRETGDEVLYIVADGVNYGIHQEFGTVKMAAHPFMVPAVENVRPGFAAAFQNKLTDKQVDAVCRKIAFSVVGIAQQMAPVDTGALKNSIHMVKGDTFSVTFENERDVRSRGGDE